MSTVTLKAGEAKTLRFTVTDTDGDAVNLTTATLTFTVKKRKDDSSPMISKTDSHFDKTQAASGIVDLPILATDTAIPAATYTGELKTVFTATNIDKSADITFVVEQAVN